MPKQQGRKTRYASRNKGKPYTKEGASNSEENATNHTNCEEEPAICPVCESAILESTEDSQSSGDEAVFCEGKCEAWFHRKCAGLSKTAYTMASESESPFYCMYCLQVLHANEIAELKAQISSLTSKVAQFLAPEQLQNSHSDVSTNIQPLRKASESSNRSREEASTKKQFPDRKYNVVVYGIQECAEGTSKTDRNKHDVKHVLPVFSKLDEEIQALSIRDCLRLGKYKPNSQRPRPILVRLNRTMDVSSILSKRKELPAGVTIKPDMSIEERQAEGMLLKERWSLIQSGVDKRQIKIKSSTLYIQGKKHAEVSNSILVKASPPTLSNSMDTDPVTSDNSGLSTNANGESASTNHI